MKNVHFKWFIIFNFIMLVLFPTGASAKDYYEAASLTELENVIFQGILNRETMIKIRYFGDVTNIRNDVRAARDHAVVRDQYAESNISLISGFKISKYANYADISFDAFQYFTTQGQEQFVDLQVKKIVKQIASDKLSPQAREKAIYDYLHENLDYDQSLANYTAYTGLQTGLTVCNGYVQLGYKLLNQAGLEAKMVKGTYFHNNTAKDHAWLLVKLDGKWYHLDPTLDEYVANSGKPFQYYNLSDEEISLDHSFDQTAYPLAPDKFPVTVNTMPDSRRTGGSGSKNDKSVQFGQAKLQKFNVPLKMSKNVAKQIKAFLAALNKKTNYNDLVGHELLYVSKS